MRNMGAVLMSVVLGLLLGGCGGGGGNEDFSDGFYRFVHVSPGTDNVNITSNGNPIATSLEYHAATPYIAFNWGTPSITVQSATTGATYVDSRIPVASNGHYSYFLYGGGSSAIALSLRDDTGDASTDNFNLRNIHLATGIGPLDIYLLPPGSTVDASTPTVASVAYVTAYPFSQVAIGNYNIVVTPTGSKEVVYSSGLQSFSANAKVSLLIFSAGSGRLVNAALMLDDSNGTTTFIDNPAARFKFVSATADIAAVDVLVDDSVNLTGVLYGSVAAYGAITAGTRNFKIQPSNAPGAYVYDQAQTIAPASDYSLAAYSIQGSGAAGLLALQDNNLPPPSGKAKLRIANAGSDATAYDVYAGSSKLLSDVAQGTASAYLELDGGTYTLTFNPAGTTSAAAAVTTTLEASHVYTVYAYGRSGSAAAVVTTDY